MTRAIPEPASAGGSTARPPLPTPWLRRAALALAIACIVVAAALGITYHGQSHGGWLDAALDPRIQSAFGRFPRALGFLAGTGTFVPVSLMVAALAAACLATRRWTGAVLAAVAEPAAAVLTEWVLKPLVGRTIGGGSPSFPSGHATAMFALAVTVAVLLAAPPRRRWPPAVRVLVVLAALLAAAAVALAMVALGAHYITDAIGGAAIGTGVSLGCALILDLLVTRLQPLAEPPDPRQPGQQQAGQQQTGQQQTGQPRPAPAAPRRSAG